MRRILFFIFLFFFLKLNAEKNFEKEPPRLVLNIVVEGLQNHHLHKLSQFSDGGGFKKIFADGVFFPNMEFGYFSGGAATDCASLMTGTLPAYHGILGEKFFNQKTKEIQPIALDERFSGIGTTSGFSPENLFASTFSDELKIATQSRAKVIAIAPRASQAIMLGGHAADAAVWLDEQVGRIATSTFYEQGLPAWCDKRNEDGMVDEAFAYVWEPLYLPFNYDFPPSGKSDKSKPFSYKAEELKSVSQARKNFFGTPNVNKLVRRLAMDALVDENLGKGLQTDVLSLFFTTLPLIENAQELLCAEKEDMFFRLDKELKTLLDAVEKSVGLANTLVVLSGTQCAALHSSTLKKHKIPTGEFSSARAMALLNNYLMLLNGQGNWVLACQGRQIYLNERLAESKKIDFRLIEYQAQRFMTEFQGVQTVFITRELLAVSSGEGETSAAKNSINSRRGGTLYFTLLPGWQEADGVAARSQITAPLAFFGFGLKPKRCAEKVRIDDVAPTISSLLFLPAPNAATGKILNLNF